MTWHPFAIAILGLLALIVFYAGAYALCLNENYHNILAYQYADVPEFCRETVFFPFSLLW